jgi:hypothetical protein
MSLLLWFLYAFVLLLVWYEKWGIVQGIPFKPPILCRRYMAVFWVSRLALTFAALAGLWRLYGLKTALVCLVGYVVLRTVSLHYYFERECRRWIEHYKKTELEKAAKAGTVIDERKLFGDATEFAKFVVAKNLKE